MLTFIVNPAAGHGASLKTEKLICAEMDKRGVSYKILHTEYPGHATVLARNAANELDCNGVVAVGGDGTCYEVACGLQGTDAAFGIIPSGTGNDFIKTVGIPAKPLEALEVLLTRKPRPVDVGAINDRLFINVCGTGFDVTVLDYTLEAKKYVKGILPYLVGILRAIFRYHPVHVRFTADGKTQERDVLVCSIANGRFIGGGIPICLEASPDDGMLDLVVVENVPRWRIPFYLPGLLGGKVLKFKITSHVRCKSVEVFSKGMRLNVDGEVIPMDEARFSVQPGSMLLYW